MSEAAETARVMLHVLVEMDVGGGRCGVDTPDAARDLAACVARSPGLVFDGLQAYQGRAQHKRSFTERRAAIADATRAARAARDAIRDAGLACDTVTGAGTGTFELEATGDTYTELQCGSYVFMDADYARNLRGPSNSVPEFGHALTLLATVISVPLPERAVIDAGLKAMSVDSGPPSLALHPGLEHAGTSDEHTTLTVAPGMTVRPGDRVQLIPGHCDPTVGMHDWLVVHENGIVTDLWPVARGW